MDKLVKTKDLFDCQTPYLISLFDECEFPWEMLPKIKDLAKKIIAEGLEGYTLLCDGVLVGENVKIYPTATIEGPTVIGSGTEIRPGAFAGRKPALGCQGKGRFYSRRDPSFYRDMRYAGHQKYRSTSGL